MTSKLLMVRGPHLLYTGTNGFETWGITVRVRGTSAEVALMTSRGFCTEYQVNEQSLRNAANTFRERLGLSPAQWELLLSALEKRVNLPAFLK
jgi:hypothetical protein